MQKMCHCARFVPVVHRGNCARPVGRVVQHRVRLASQATSSSETTAPSIPQQVNIALQHRQTQIADLADKLETRDPSPELTREVFDLFQDLSEQVQRLAQHMEAAESKVQAKAAEKALKKERKAEEKALKKERKATEKAAKALAKDSMASTGFTVEPEADFAAELNHATVGMVGGDTAIMADGFGSNFAQGSQHAAVLPTSSTATAPAAVISVCQGSSCQEKGGVKLLNYIKDAAGAEIDVIPCKCLGKCEQAANLRVRLPEQKPVLHTGVSDVQQVNKILQDTKAHYGSDMMKSFAAAN